MLDRIVIAGAGRTIESIFDRLLNLAPLLVLDNAQAALDELSLTATMTPRRFEMTKRLADATSRITLEDARQDPRSAVALVVATGDDRRNMEVCRLASEIGYQPVVALVIDPARTADYEALGARPIVRAQILGRVVEQALRYDGLVAASSVGQGRGEIIEFSVLPSSPAVGLPLAKLRAERWRIAAIYRGGRLVIPTGNTIIAAADRLLLIGEPEILHDVVQELRIGVPQFPLRFGARIVLYQPEGSNANLEREAELLLRGTRAEGMLQLAPAVQPKSEVLAVDDHVPAFGPSRQRKTREVQPLQGSGLSAHLAQLRSLRPGVLVIRPPRRTLLQYLSGRGGAAAELCNTQSCPVLFSCGVPAYERLVYVLLADSGAVADTAIDLARMLQIPLVVARVDLPEYIEERDQQIDTLGLEVERRATFHGVRIERQSLTGNPVGELVRLARPGDLLLMYRRHGSRNSFTSPDVALRVAGLVVGAAVLVQTGPTR